MYVKEQSLDKAASQLGFGSDNDVAPELDCDSIMAANIGSTEKDISTNKPSQQQHRPISQPVSEGRAVIKGLQPDRGWPWAVNLNLCVIIQ